MPVADCIAATASELEIPGLSSTTIRTRLRSPSEWILLAAAKKASAAGSTFVSASSIRTRALSPADEILCAELADAGESVRSDSWFLCERDEHLLMIAVARNRIRGSEERFADRRVFVVRSNGLFENASFISIGGGVLTLHDRTKTRSLTTTTQMPMNLCGLLPARMRRPFLAPKSARMSSEKCCFAFASTSSPQSWRLRLPATKKLHCRRRL
jgi:hypothetical protein